MGLTDPETRKSLFLSCAAAWYRLAETLKYDGTPGGNDDVRLESHASPEPRTVNGESANRKQVTTTADSASGSRANQGVFFSGAQPSADLTDLALALASRGTKSKNEVARDFCGGNDKKAKSCLAQIRRLVLEGRISFA